MRAGVATLLLVLCALPARAEPVRVGSKKFTESVLLAEAVRLSLERTGVEAVHRKELGGSRVLWEALQRGDVDLYPEYTGTLTEELLRSDAVRSEAELDAALSARGLRRSGALGFDNTYALAVRKDAPASLQRISQLAAFPQLRLAFSHEFLDRADGWPGLRERYGLSGTPRGLDHDLAYRALASGEVDVSDVYRTDPEIDAYALRLLEDDRRYFPPYRALLLYRADLAERVERLPEVLGRLEGHLSEERMRALNARAQLEKVPEEQVARELVDGLSSSPPRRATAAPPSLLQRVLTRTREHALLVLLSLGAAILCGVPLGVAAALRPRLGRLILGAAGVVQTIPSLALLVFLLPVLGIGTAPALVALWLYSVLPIVRNTASGLSALPQDLRESAMALGLTPRARLLRVELPMALPPILAGIQTAAVINVGTATLGALIGAGGYGQPILSGIRLADTPLILEGALPAAAMALGAQALLTVVERWLVPRGLKLGR